MPAFCAMYSPVRTALWDEHLFRGRNWREMKKTKGQGLLEQLQQHLCTQHSIKDAILVGVSVILKAWRLFLAMCKLKARFLLCFKGFYSLQNKASDVHCTHVHVHVCSHLVLPWSLSTNLLSLLSAHTQATSWTRCLHYSSWQQWPTQQRTRLCWDAVSHRD